MSGIEAHCGSEVEVVSRPAGVTIGGEEIDPGCVHGVRELLRRVFSELRPKQREVWVQCVENEWDLKPMDGAAASAEPR